MTWGRPPTTAKERDGVRQLCQDELAKEEHQDFPHMATVTLHATGILTLLDEYDQLLGRKDKPTMTGDLMDRLEKVYAAAKVALPLPRAIALRLIEEVVELCLACGASPADIHNSVHNALHHEHSKHPEQGFNEGIADDIQIAGEIADVMLLTDFCRKLASVTDEEVGDLAEHKIERLTRAQVQGNLLWTEDGRFYRTKGSMK